MSVLVEGGAHEMVHVVHPSDVGGNGPRPASSASHPVRGGFEAVPPPPGEQGRRAGPSECHGRRASQGSRCSGDDGHLALEHLLLPPHRIPLAVGQPDPGFRAATST